MKTRSIDVFVLLCLFFTGYAQTLPPAGSFDADLFTGIWYETALYPADMRKGCHCTTIEFEYVPGNKFVGQTIRCIRFHKEKSKIHEYNLKLYPEAGTPDTVSSVMHILRLRPKMHSREYFEFLNFTADHSIAILVNQSKGSLQLLSRDAFIPAHIYKDILKLIKDHGYDSNTLQKTPLNCDIIE